MLWTLRLVQQLTIPVSPRVPPFFFSFFFPQKVSSGYGRGSKKLGIPTANLPESQFSDYLKDIDAGVYLGWALVEGMEDPSLSVPKKAVVNIGYAPTFVEKVSTMMFI